MSKLFDFSFVTVPLASSFSLKVGTEIAFINPIHQGYSSIYKNIVICGRRAYLPEDVQARFCLVISSKLVKGGECNFHQTWERV